LELKKKQQQEVIVLTLYKHHQRELLLIKCHLFRKPEGQCHWGGLAAGCMYTLKFW
jgi:hypothetical protein